MSKIAVEYVKTGKVVSMQERFARPLIKMGVCVERSMMQAAPEPTPPPPPPPAAPVVEEIPSAVLRRGRGRYARRDVAAAPVNEAMASDPATELDLDPPSSEPVTETSPSEE
jgi:hypothetical protein